ncbi:autotransporter outer membrane beta-barrel domain-containing protein, partial [Sinorhizobium medicae]
MPDISPGRTSFAASDRALRRLSILNAHVLPGAPSASSDRIRCEFNKLLLGSVASIALFCSLDSEARAACVETSPGAYDCSGTGPGPTFTGQSVTINADPTASFTSDVSITGPGTSTLNNNGTLTNSLRATDNDRFTLNNRGLIDGTIFLGGSGANVIINYAGGDVQNGVTSTGDSHDTVINRGFFAGSIVLGDGYDVLGLIEGTVQTSVDMGAGDDQFTWLVGNIAATVQMGEGDDRAVFGSLTQQNLSAGKRVDGGLGIDTLVWENTTNDDGGGSGDHPENIVNWEEIELRNGSEMTFIYSTGNLTLGDSASGTGTLSIDETSAVRAGNSFGYGVRAFDPSQLVTVYNAGIIDMTNDTVNVGDLLHDTFTVYGNYVGQQGGLQLHTVLESDDAPSDKLVISGTGASASGGTSILITNVGGQGALTLADGIRVVDATAGATTEGTAFTLGAPVAAGIFEYKLYRGGLTEDPDNDDDWFLR